jgi:manganese/zinc/iron transport system permease protein
MDYNTLVVVAGVSILGASAGLVGAFAVLRRRALTGDALSHAALPGVCLAFLFTREKHLPLLLLGAFLSGLLGVVIIGALRRWTRIKEDASIGVVLSVFFGAGLALSTFIQKNVPGGSKAGLTSYILGETAGMVAADVYLIAGCAAACLVVVLLLYKEFKLIAFDAGFARVQGWPASWLDLLLMALLAVTVILGLPAVGAVLMAALVILPGATARLWTDRLGPMLVLAALIGAGTGLLGTVLSARYAQMPAGPIIILVGSAFFVASLALSPRHGLVAEALGRRKFRRELEERQLLRLLFDLAEPSLPGPVALSREELTARRAWPPGRLASLLGKAVREGYLEPAAEGRYLLTPKGARRAAEVARGHRLWGLFLTRHADLATAMANLGEESVDGLLPAELVEELEDELRRQGRHPIKAVCSQTFS